MAREVFPYSARWVRLTGGASPLEAPIGINPMATPSRRQGHHRESMNKKVIQGLVPEARWILESVGFQYFQVGYSRWGLDFLTFRCPRDARS